MEKLDKSLKSITSSIKTSARLYPSNKKIQNYYIKYCTKQVKAKKRPVKRIIQKSKKSNFVLNPKLATKTLYHLFYSQKKYSDAYNVLVIMQNNKKNKTFVSNAMKTIQRHLPKG